jgi:hypothetical protein
MILSNDNCAPPLLLCLQAADPLQNLFITGTSCKLLRGAESHATNEAGENLVPWNGQQDNMIDRSVEHSAAAAGAKQYIALQLGNYA